MSNALALVLPGGATVAETILAPLGDLTLTVVDVGARNGMFRLPSAYAERAELIGFEPNKEEHAKLVERRTDAMLDGSSMPRFRSERFFDCALWDRAERRPFYVTAGVGASTMMGQADARIAGRMFRGRVNNDDGKSLYERHFAVRETQPVECRRLDALLHAERFVDLLKIDVEGGELRVLRGAEGLLAQHRVLFILSEFNFAPFYTEHPSLGDQQVYLAERGFRLLDLEAHGRNYSRDPTSIPEENDRRPIYGGDAFFTLDPDRMSLDKTVLQRLAALHFALGFHSFGISLLRDAGLTTPPEISAIETALHRIPLGRRLATAWRRLPVHVHQSLMGLKASLRRAGTRRV
jgi:FkbM family methyltransferase